MRGVFATEACIRNGQFQSLLKAGMMIHEGRAYNDERCIRQRPVRGRKKPSATIFARAFGMGFWRFFSTAMREEKVRTLRALGPVNLSAASAAMG